MTAGDLLLEGNARLQGWWAWIRKRFPELIKAVGPDISDEAIEGGCSLILRTPALFLLDAWYASLYRGGILRGASKKNLTNYEEDGGIPIDLTFTDQLPATISTAIHLALPVVASLLLILPLEILVNFWMHIISGALVFLAQAMTDDFIEEELNILNHFGVDQDEGEIHILPALPSLTRYVNHVLSLVALCYIINWALDIRYPPLKWLPLAHALPIISSLPKFLLVQFSLSQQESLHVFYQLGSIAVALGFTLLLISKIPTVIRYINMMVTVAKVYLQRYGPLSAFMTLMTNIVDHKQFILFWSGLFINRAWSEYALHLRLVAKGGTGFVKSAQDWPVFLLFAATEICQSPLTLIATSATVMAGCNCAIRATSYYLATCKAHAPPNPTIQSGVGEGMVMFMLALQTGLTEIQMPQRVGAMSVILYIVLAILFQSLLEVTHPVLLALSAQAPSSKSQVLNHAKVLALCLVIFTIPLAISFAFVEALKLDMWMMVIISSSILTSIQVIGHVIHYGLFLRDTLRDEPTESLDDIVFYMKSFIALLELASALFVICAGVKDGWIGNWSVVNIAILLIHFYFNVWTRIVSGWKSFTLRLIASTRIQTLVEASEEQLRLFNDVCAICYLDMIQSAKITPCGHYFHGRCLKKWLYLNDQCPMCQANLIEENLKQDNPRENVREEELVLDENEAALDEEQEANLENLEGHEGQAEGNEVVVEDIPRPQEVEAD